MDYDFPFKRPEKLRLDRNETNNISMSGLNDSSISNVFENHARQFTFDSRGLKDLSDRNEDLSHLELRIGTILTNYNEDEVIFII
jgi:hypothetical protein